MAGSSKRSGQQGRIGVRRLIIVWLGSWLCSSATMSQVQGAQDPYGVHAYIGFRCVKSLERLS
jgi:hypothetical protein